MDSPLPQLLENWRRVIASLTLEEYDFVEQRLEQGWVYGSEPLYPIGADTEVAVTSEDVPVDGQEKVKVTSEDVPIDGQEKVAAVAADLAVSEACERGSGSAVDADSEATAELQQQRVAVDRFM